MNSIPFPPFNVIDGSWGPCKLSVSESTGMSILAKKTAVENWPWHEMSHATVKNYPKRIVQVKKICGVKKVITFASYEDLNCFERSLKNACPVKVTTNKRFQRKLVILQAAAIESDHPAPAFLQANYQLEQPVWSSLNAASPSTRALATDKAHSVKAVSKIPPPPPPPPMPPMVKLVGQTNKPQTVKPNLPITHGSVLDEIKTKFAGGALKASDIRAMVKNQVDRPKPCYLQQQVQTIQPAAAVEVVQPKLEPIPEQIHEHILEQVAEPMQPVVEPIQPPAEPIQPLANRDADNHEVEDVPPELSNSPTNRAERHFRIWTAEATERPFMSAAFRAAVRRDLHFHVKDTLASELELILKKK